MNKIKKAVWVLIGIILAFIIICFIAGSILDGMNYRAVMKATSVEELQDACSSKWYQAANVGDLPTRCLINSYK